MSERTKKVFWNVYWMWLSSVLVGFVFGAPWLMVLGLWCTALSGPIVYITYWLIDKINGVLKSLWNKKG